MNETINDNDYNESQLAIVDLSTGEILKTIGSDDRMKITRSEQAKYLETHIIDFNREKHFVKLFDEVAPILHKYLSSPEVKVLFAMLHHISYDDCVLHRTFRGNSNPLTMQEFADLYDYKYEYVRKLFAALKRKGVIAKIETGYVMDKYIDRYSVVWAVNPNIFFRGADVSKEIVNIFKKSGWSKIMEDYNKKSNENVE